MSAISNPFDEVKGQIVLGSDGFVERIRSYFHRGSKVRELPALRSLKKVLTIEEVLTEVANYFHVERERLISKGSMQFRQIAMEMAYRCVFRRIPDTHSEASRTPIPIDPGQPFRSIPDTL